MANVACYLLHSNSRQQTPQKVLDQTKAKSPENTGPNGDKTQESVQPNEG